MAEIIIDGEDREGVAFAIIAALKGTDMEIVHVERRFHHDKRGRVETVRLTTE